MFHSPSTTRPRAVVGVAAAREYGVADFAAFVDVARETVDDRTGDAALARRGRQYPAPAGAVVTSVVLDDDDVARASAFDGGSAQMSLRCATPGRNEFDGDDAPNDFRRTGERPDAVYGAACAELVERVRDRAGIERGQPGQYLRGAHCQIPKPHPVPVPATVRYAGT